MARLTYGGFYFSTPAATTLGAATPAKAAGSTTALQLGDFTHSDNRLTYEATVTRDFEVMAAISLTKASGSASVASLLVAKNGSPVTGLRVDRSCPEDTDERLLVVVGNLSLTEDDYVELFLETDTGDDLTVESGVMTCKVIG